MIYANINECQRMKTNERMRKFTRQSIRSFAQGRLSYQG